MTGRPPGRPQQRPVTLLPVLLEGKKLLITGVLTDRSIAFAAARSAQEHGAEVLLTGFGKGLSLTRRIARRLPQEPDVLEMDVNEPAQVDAVAGAVRERWGTLDGVLHAIAYAPPDALGGNFLNTPWDSVRVAFQTSAYSLKALVAPLVDLLAPGGSVVSLDFDARVAWPIYDWMGVSKAALEAVTRYLARDLGPHGIRVNTVGAGPIRTIAARGIPGFDELAGPWARRAPLGWDGDPGPVADTIVFLFSDLSRAVTGELIHVDGGFHAMGTEPPATRGESPPEG